MNYFILSDYMEVGFKQVNQLDPIDWIWPGVKTISTTPLISLTENSSDLTADLVSGLYTIFSEKLKIVLTDFGINTVDYHKIKLVHSVTKKECDNYWIVNINKSVACVDREKSKITFSPSGREMVESFQIIEEKTEGLHLFRLDEKPTLIIITKELHNYLRTQRLAGIKYRRTEEYDGW